MFNDLEGDNADENNDDGLSGNEDDDEDAGKAIDAFGAHDGDLSENEDGEGGDSAALLRQLETELADELAAEEDDEKQDSDGDGDGFDAATDDNEEEDEDEEEDYDNGASGNADDEEAAAALALAWRKDYAPSVFQRAQTKLSWQIETLEERALQEKPWLLKGEASARERPTNSMLEADLEFEHVQAPPPVVSEEMTAKLEDLVKTRIAEQRFDDVERVEPGLDGRAWQKLLEMSFNTLANPRFST
jgi:U3 small nucleolar RNA-associated protein MPP10